MLERLDESDQIMNVISMLRSFHRPVAVKAGLLISIYMCQTLSLGYVFGSLPVIMRQQNMSLKSIGAIFLLHLPWAVKFIYATWIDRYYFSTIGRRRSWIIPMQWIAAVILLALSWTPPETHFGLMYVLIFLLHVAMATNDIAVDGYATDILLPHERAWGNTIQSGARFVGMMLGGGLMLFLHTSLGWQNLCLILSGTVILLSLPVVLHRELPSVSDAELATEEQSAYVRSFLKTKAVQKLLLMLILPTAFIFAGTQMRMPLLVDLGLSVRELGAVMMNWAYPAGLVGTILSGWLMNKVGEKVFLRLFSMIALLVNTYALLCAAKSHVEIKQATLMLCSDNILIGGINVWAYTKMMHASAGNHAAANFAVLSSLFIIVPMLCLPLFGAIGDRWGFTSLNAILVVLILIGAFMAEQIQNTTAKMKLLNY